MTHTKAKFTIWLVLAALAAAVIIGCKEKPQNGGQTPEDKKQIAQGDAASSEPVAVKPIAPSKPTLRDIIAKRRGWGPAYVEWYGKEAPDFNVTDITGKQHTLSQYKGRNVMLIFWATWCGPCIREMPHLIELRNTIGEDKLAMLAISYIDPRNSAETVKKFITANPVINYTVISTDGRTMPSPYYLVTTIPSTFFIDPDGKIKIVTEGTISVSQIKAILEADPLSPPQAGR